MATLCAILLGAMLVTGLAALVNACVALLATRDEQIARGMVGGLLALELVAHLARASETVFRLGMAVSVALYLWFFARATNNLIRRGLWHYGGTGGTTLAWHFMPIVCLWVPYQRITRIWRISRDPGESIAAPWTMLIWWLSWQTASVLLLADIEVGGRAGRYGYAPIDSDLLSPSLLVNAGYYFALVVSLILLVPVVLQITRMQDGARTAATA